MWAITVGVVGIAIGGDTANAELPICRHISDRLTAVTAEQLKLLIDVPLTGRVTSQCALMLAGDVAQGQKCVVKVCEEVEREGIVEQANTTSPVAERLSRCAQATNAMLKLETAHALLRQSYTTLCGSRPAPRPPS